MNDLLTQPWPWYVAGPLIGLMTPLLLLAGGKFFGISSSLRHICTFAPIRPTYFRYNLKGHSWNLVFVLGLLLGGFLAMQFMHNPNDVALSESTVGDLRNLGFTDFSGMMPKELFGWDQVGLNFSTLLMVVGGLLVGFGTSYAGGCTSGHCITGLSQLSVASLVATIGFFAGGLLMTHFVFPFIF